MDIIPIPGFSEPFSSICHLIAAGIAVIGSFLLIRKGRGNGSRQFGLSLYSFSLIFLFSMSGVYHLLEPGNTPRMALQRLDHAGIYVLIAGTITAIHFTFFNKKKRWIVSTLVWVLATTGLVLTVVFFDSIPQWLLSSFYLGLGWLGLATGYLLKVSYGTKTFLSVLKGGCIYSVGALIMYFDRPVLIPGVLEAHEIFHICVVLAAYTHWKLIYDWANNPSSQRLTFIVRKRAGDKFVASADTEKILIRAPSIEEMRKKISQAISKSYHPSLLPVSIRLKLSEEEIFEVDQSG